MQTKAQQNRIKAVAGLIEDAITTTTEVALQAAPFHSSEDVVEFAIDAIASDRGMAKEDAVPGEVEAVIRATAIALMIARDD